MNRAWWHEPMMWLVLGGPAIVVVASIATYFIAAGSPDPLVADDYYRRGLEINKTSPVPDPALRPAGQARNHAATPVVGP